MQNRRCINGYFFNNSSTAHVQLLIKMVLCTFISLQLFTAYMENSLQFEISLPSNSPKWNLHQSEFYFTWTHVKANI